MTNPVVLERPSSYCVACGHKLGKQPPGMGYREWEAKQGHLQTCKILASMRRQFEDGILPHALEHMEHGARRWAIAWTEIRKEG